MTRPTRWGNVVELAWLGAALLGMAVFLVICWVCRVRVDDIGVDDE